MITFLCDQAREAVMDQEVAMHGSIIAAHYEKERDISRLLIFFSSFTTRCRSCRIRLMFQVMC